MGRAFSCWSLVSQLATPPDPLSSSGHNSRPQQRHNSTEGGRDMGKASSRDDLLRLLAPVVAAHGYDLEDVVITPAGKRRMLRVIVDKDGGVDLDDVARVASSVSGTLDTTDTMGGTPYVIEVTSPGVDRPLIQPRHWRRAVERLVTVGIAGVGERTGRVLATDDDGVELDIDGTPTRVPWVDLAPGRVQVEFNRASTREE
jgi:ribosome maturation factor RimP